MLPPGLGGLSAQDCGLCHGRIYEQWAASRHARVLFLRRFGRTAGRFALAQDRTLPPPLQRTRAELSSRQTEVPEHAAARVIQLRPDRAGPPALLPAGPHNVSTLPIH